MKKKMVFEMLCKSFIYSKIELLALYDTYTTVGAPKGLVQYFFIDSCINRVNLLRPSPPLFLYGLLHVLSPFFSSI